MAKTSNKQSTKIKPLTPFEESFIAAYITNGGKGGPAALAAGSKCKTAAARDVQASRLLRNDKVSAEIAKKRSELQKAADVSAQEVIQVLAAHLRSDITELLGKGGAFDLEHVRKAGLGRLIKKMELKRVAGKPARVTPKGTAVKATQGFTYVSKIELHGAQTGAGLLSRILGMEQKKGENKNDPEYLRKVLEARIQFGLIGYATVAAELTKGMCSACRAKPLPIPKRRDLLEAFADNPDALMDGMLAVIQAELASEAIQ